MRVVYYYEMTSNEYYPHVVKIVSVDMCCDDMKTAFNDSFINIGKFDTFFNNDPNVNIYHCKPYPEGPVYDEMPISFCPFCGEEVDLVGTSSGEQE